MPKRLYCCGECDDAVERDEFCFRCDSCSSCCECDFDLFDADELGLDPEDDEQRRFPDA